MSPPLNTLACFTHINAIEPINKGLSSQCYLVKADNKKFFAKQITTTIEPIVSLLTAKNNLSPNVVYYDKYWLVTKFIEGKNLVESAQPIMEKSAIAIRLMVQYHQLLAKQNKYIPKAALNPKAIINDLIDQLYVSTTEIPLKLVKQKTELMVLANQILSALSNPTNVVYCHGDINFSNIILSTKKQAYLIDYECSCFAPIEYDLAMFIAVNNLPKKFIPDIAQLYKTYSFSNIDINLSSLNHYLQFCYFINSLWYVSAFHTSGLPTLTFLAEQQWQKLHAYELLPIAFSHLI